MSGCLLGPISSPPPGKPCTLNQRRTLFDTCTGVIIAGHNRVLSINLEQESIKVRVGYLLCFGNIGRQNFGFFIPSSWNLPVAP